MRRIGSNIRKQNTEEKIARMPKNIIRYTTEEKPSNEYPKRIVSPPHGSACCTDDNREVVGMTREVEGFKYSYKICTSCGHALRYFYPAAESTNTAVKEYRDGQTYMPR